MPRAGWQFFGSGGAREKVWGGGGIDSEGGGTGMAKGGGGIASEGGGTGMAKGGGVRPSERGGGISVWEEGERSTAIVRALRASGELVDTHLPRTPHSLPFRPLPSPRPIPGTKPLFLMILKPGLPSHISN